MKEETNEETIVRYRELQRIKTKQEYENAKERLEYYKTEYTWIKESENPMDDVRKEIESLMPMLNGENTDSQRHYLKHIQFLMNKRSQIKKDRYLPIIKQNITALLLTTRQYELEQKDYNILDLLKGVIKGDNTILEALKMRHVFSSVITFGNMPAEENLSLPSVEDALEFIAKHCNLVGIEVPDYKRNLALVPVEKEKRTPYQEVVQKIVDEYIQETDSNNSVEQSEKSITLDLDKENQDLNQTLEKEVETKTEQKLQLKSKQNKNIDNKNLENSKNEILESSKGEVER